MDPNEPRENRSQGLYPVELLKYHDMTLYDLFHNLSKFSMTYDKQWDSQYRSIKTIIYLHTFQHYNNASSCINMVR